MSYTPLHFFVISFHREYWMIYRAPGFLVVVSFGSFFSLPLQSVGSTGDTQEDWKGETEERGRRVGRGVKSQVEWAWASINHSILSAFSSTFRFSFHSYYTPIIRRKPFSRFFISWLPNLLFKKYLFYISLKHTFKAKTVAVRLEGGGGWGGRGHMWIRLLSGVPLYCWSVGWGIGWPPIEWVVWDMLLYSTVEKNKNCALFISLFKTFSSFHFRLHFYF